jgi:hypothetical protein
VQAIGYRFDHFRLAATQIVVPQPSHLLCGEAKFLFKRDIERGSGSTSFLRDSLARPIVTRYPKFFETPQVSIVNDIASDPLA